MYLKVSVNTAADTEPLVLLSTARCSISALGYPWRGGPTLGTGPV